MLFDNLRYGPHGPIYVRWIVIILKTVYRRCAPEILVRSGLWMGGKSEVGDLRYLRR